MKLRTNAAALAAAMMLSGCATITTGTNQSLSVETRVNGAAVAGATCRLDNDKGTWFVSTPGSVVVNRSYGDMSVNCIHERHEPGLAVVRSSTKPIAFGNVLFGGVVGAAVDIGTGSAYDYPSLITLELGMAQSLPVEPPIQQ